MANATDYLEAALLNHVFRATSYSSPANVYLALINDDASDADMDDGDLTNEITGYTGNRPAITFGAPSQDDDVGRILNNAQIEFAGMPETSVKYIVIMDGNTKESGNMLFWITVTDGPKVVNAGDIYRVPSGQVEIRLG